MDNTQNQRRIMAIPIGSPSSEISSPSLSPGYSTNSSCTSLSSCASLDPSDPKSTEPATKTSTSRSLTSTYAQSILRRQAAALLSAADRFEQQGSSPLDVAFEEALAAISQLRVSNGRLVLAGIGKSGILAKKAAATFCSLGTPAFFLDPVAALHGDLGLLSPNGSDVAILISYSGNTQEVIELAARLQARCQTIVALTSNHRSSLALSADIWLDASIGGDGLEADPTLPAPTSSLVVSMGLLDALALSALRSLTGWTASHQAGREVFGSNHPGGSLGLELNKVDN